jgi:hypothetical protein
LRNADFSIARTIADSLLAVYLNAGKVKKNLGENRLEGETEIDKSLIESVSGSRAGEEGAVFLNSEKLGNVTLAGFDLNWCDFYGALVEATYTPKKKFNIKKYIPDALYVFGPISAQVKGCALKEAGGPRAKKIEKFFSTLDTLPFEGITAMDIQAYEYLTKGVIFCVVNFSTGERFTPGAAFMLKDNGKSFIILGQYYIGEKAKYIQSVREEGDANPVIQVGTFGSGTEYIVLHFDGMELAAVYKRKEKDFP